jgi:hypothetical protein
LNEQHTETAIAELVRVATQSPSNAVRVAACQTLLDRGWGRPLQGLDVQVNDVTKRPVPMIDSTMDLNTAAAAWAATMRADENGMVAGADLEDRFKH